MRKNYEGFLNKAKKKANRTFNKANRTFNKARKRFKAMAQKPKDAPKDAPKAASPKAAPKDAPKAASPKAAPPKAAPRTGGKYKWIKDKYMPSFKIWKKTIKKRHLEEEKDKFIKQFEEKIKSQNDKLIQDKVNMITDLSTFEQTKKQQLLQDVLHALYNSRQHNHFLSRKLDFMHNTVEDVTEQSMNNSKIAKESQDAARKLKRLFLERGGPPSAVESIRSKIDHLESELDNTHSFSDIQQSLLAHSKMEDLQHLNYKKLQKKADEAVAAAEREASNAAAAVAAAKGEPYDAIAGFKGQREGASFRGCDRNSNLGYNCIPDYRGPNKRWDNSNKDWEDASLNANDYNIYDKYINTFNETNKNIKYSLTNQFMNRCSAINNYHEIKTWAESLLENNDNLHNKRIDISYNGTDWHYTIDFYRTAGENDGSFVAIENTTLYNEGTYSIDNNNILTITENDINCSITINDDKTIDFSYNDILFNTTDYNITNLYDVNDIKDRELSWENACNNESDYDNGYNDTFTIFKSGLISNRNDQINDQIASVVEDNYDEEVFVKKFYSDGELSHEFNGDIFDNYRDSTNHFIYQYNTGLRKSIGKNYQDVYDLNEGEIPAIFLAPHKSDIDNGYSYVGFGNLNIDNLETIGGDYTHQVYRNMDSSINTLCSGYSATDDDSDPINQDDKAVCLLDYMNVHLEQYQRYLCDKLPNNINYIKQENANTCRNLKNSLWSWTPNENYIKSKNISYNDFDKWNKLETQKDKSAQDKDDTKQPYFNKRTKIILLIIGILLLLYLVKKY